MTIDPFGFRRALGAFPTGVAVATTLGPDGEPVGITISSFNSVSLDPPLVLWSINKKALCYEEFTTGTHFVVNVLSHDEAALSARFSQRTGDKFSGLAWRRGTGGVPILPDFAACFECAVEHRYDGGDHTIIVGRVTAFEDRDKAPLIFHRGQFLPGKGDA